MSFKLLYIPHAVAPIAKIAPPIGHIAVAVATTSVMATPLANFIHKSIHDCFLNLSRKFYLNLLKIYLNDYVAICSL